MALFALSVALAAAQPANAQSADDFEAALYGTESGNSGGTASPADGGTTLRTGAFDARAAEGEKATTEYLMGGTAVVEGSAYGSLDERTVAETSDVNGKLFGKVTIPDGGDALRLLRGETVFRAGIFRPGERAGRRRFEAARVEPVGAVLRIRHRQEAVRQIGEPARRMGALQDLESRRFHQS